MRNNIAAILKYALFSFLGLGRAFETMNGLLFFLVIRFTIYFLFGHHFQLRSLDVKHMIMRGWRFSIAPM